MSHKPINPTFAPKVVVMINSPDPTNVAVNTKDGPMNRKRCQNPSGGWSMPSALLVVLLMRFLADVWFCMSDGLWHRWQISNAG